MEPDNTKFCEYLACYGSDIRSWPEEARMLGLRMQHHPEYAALIEQEKFFEKLLGSDTVPPARCDLISSILRASLSRPAVMPPAWYSQMGAYVSPTALAAMLLIGFAIGFNALPPLSSNEEESFLQSYSDDEEMTL